jgi:hypothetical protein
MLNRKYIDEIFLVLGIFLAFLLIRFGQGLAELWKYGLIYSATLIIFVSYLIQARSSESDERQDMSGDKRKGNEEPAGRFLIAEAYPTLLFVFLFCILCIVLFLPTPFEFISDYDWSHQLAGANQILKGEHPFITFLDFYGPLTFYSSALAQYISGTRAIGEIFLIILGYSVAYTIIFWLMWSLSRDKSLSFILVSILIILIPKLYKYYIVLGPALSLLFIWIYLDAPTYKKMWLVGLAVVLTGLYRPDFGAYMALSAATAIILRSKKTFAFKQILIDLIYFGGILIVLASPWLIFVTLGGGLRDYLYYSTIGGIVTSSGMSLPLLFSPDFLSLESFNYVATIAFNLIPGLMLIVMLRRKHRMDSDVVLKLSVLIVASQLTMIQSWHRTGWEHLLQAIPITFILFAYVFKRIQLSFWGKGRFVSLIGLVLGVGLLSSVLIYRFPNLDRISVTRTLNDLKFYRLERDQFTRALIKKYPTSPLLRAMNYIRTCTEPNDKIIAWPYLIDFYYFTNRPLGGRLKALAPTFSGPDEEQMVVRDMQADDIAYLIFRPHVFNPTIPDTRDYAPIISEYLEETYIPIQKYGQIIIYINKERQPPVDCSVR